MPRILVVGVGGDGPAGLPMAVLQRIAEADWLLGGERLLAMWPDHPGRRYRIGDNMEELARELGSRGDCRVVVLASGDPGFYGIGATLFRWFGPAGVEILPNVCSLQLAFARVGMPWHDAVFVTAHARTLAEVVAAARRARKVGILTDDVNQPARIARALLDAGIEDCRAVVAENLGLPDERITDTRLAILEDCEFGPLNVLLLVRDAAWVPSPVFAPRPDQAYAHRRGLITKADVRALAVSRMAIRETDIVWDVGAGSGAVSIEIAELAWRGRVFAIEHGAECLEFIRENAERFGAHNLEVVAGRAPQALKDLPHPNAVFVGGSDGSMPSILEAIAGRAEPGCRVVVSLATLENLDCAMRSMAELGWPAQLTQVCLAHGQAISGRTRLAPDNPVFLVKGVVAHNESRNILCRGRRTG